MVNTPPLGTLVDRVTLANPDGTNVRTFWARVRQLASRQTFGRQGEALPITHAVMMRFRTDVEPGQTIAYRGRVLTVLSFNDINARREYGQAHCSERGAQ